MHPIMGMYFARLGGYAGSMDVGEIVRRKTETRLTCSNLLVP